MEETKPLTTSKGYQIGLVSSAVLFVVFAALLFTAQVSNWHLIGQSDNAFLAECLENINDRSVPYTTVNRASHHYIELVNAFDAFESFDAAIAPPQPLEINQLQRHTYLVLYLIAPFARWISPELVLPAVKTLSMVTLMALGFFMLLRRSRKPFLPIVFALALGAHPFFTQSLQWQVYVDLMFLPAGFLLCHCLHTRWSTRHTVWIVVLCCSICEKFIFVSGVLMIAFSLAYSQDRLRSKRLYVGAGLIGLFFAITVLSGLLEPARYKYDRYADALLTANSLKNSFTYLFVSLGAYLLLVYRDRRLLFVLLVALAPNLFGSVGGAEKTGWATHYHATYFPILAYVLFHGLSARIGQDAQRSTRGTGLFLVGVALSICHPLFIDVQNVSKGPELSTRTQWFPYQYRAIHARHQSAEFTLQHLRALDREIPAGTTLCVSQNLATALYPGRALHFFPAGLDRADHIVLHAGDCKQLGSGLDYVLPPFSRDEDTNRRFDAFVTERIASLGFDTENPKVFGPWLLLSKRN